MSSIKSLSEKLKEFRRKNGLSQFDLARILKTSYSYISRLENGNRRFSINLLKKCYENGIFDETSIIGYLSELIFK